MTCHFALPFIAWLWEDEVTIQVLRRQKEEKIRLPNDEKKRLFGIGELAKASRGIALGPHKEDLQHSI